MNEVDIIRNFINLLNQQSPNQARLTPVKVEHPDETDDTAMVFPLQQKMNFLKQLTNNNFDDENTKVDQIKTMAGIDPVTLIIQDEDDNLI